MLNEIAAAFAAYEVQDAERRCEEQDRQQRKVQALEKAYQRLVLSRCVDTVLQQSRNWRMAEDLRAYSREVRLRADKVGETPPGVQAWLDWVERHLNEVLDPLNALPALPEEPRRDDPSIAEHLVTGAGRWDEAWLEWSRGRGLPLASSDPKPLAAGC